ncbi:MAG: PaaI family thioesterase [Alphaproteobacteria bacterium]|nr:PaaI family thioesterase [Alphaproteobacteria bacterium]
MSSYITPNPNFAARVRDSFGRQPFMAQIGASLTLVEPGAVDITLPHRADLTQQHGFFHGGGIGAIADNAGAYAAFSLAEADHSILTVEYKVSFVSPGAGEALIARGRVVKPGRTLVVSRSDVVAVSGGHEKLVATALVTLMLLEGRDDTPSPPQPTSPV